MRRQKENSRELTELKARVMEWRKRGGGGRGGRIPEELWQEAVQRARVDGCYATAKALRFNYERLKERCVRAADGGAKDPARSAGGEGKPVLARSKPRGGGVAPAAAGDFIALPLTPRQAPRQCLIEIAGRHGDRMRVEVMGEVDVVAVCQSFWRRAS